MNDLPPSNRLLERLILSACMRHPPLIGSIAKVIAATDFYEYRHQLIFSTMQTMRPRKYGIACLGALLRHDKTIEDPEGIAYLAELWDLNGTASIALLNAETVAELAKMRQRMKEAKQ